MNSEHSYIILINTGFWMGVGVGFRQGFECILGEGGILGSWAYTQELYQVLRCTSKKTYQNLGYSPKEE